MKTAELTGAALDWAVAMCEGLAPRIAKLSGGGIAVVYGSNQAMSFQNWIAGGPIIERERISVKAQQPDWTAYIAICDGMTDRVLRGPTPLVAAMRCFVASKLGNEVEIPKELL